MWPVSRGNGGLKTQQSGSDRSRREAGGANMQNTLENIGTQGSNTGWCKEK